MEELLEGLYEDLISILLERRLRAVPSEHLVAREKLDPAEAPAILGHYVGVLATAVFEQIRQRGSRSEAEVVQACNRIVHEFARLADDQTLSDWALEEPAERLLAYFQPRGLAQPHVPPRPGTPLSASNLLTNARGEHRIGAELRKELRSTKRVDLLCSFIKWSGYRVLEDALHAFLEGGGKLRVLTTVYMGATDQRALDELVAQGADVRISYDTRRTRLHAKAWLFHRPMQLSTAYVGSSNVSHAALTDGLEWNVRLSARKNLDIIQKFAATFESYWSDVEFEAYDPDQDHERLRKALQRDAIPPVGSTSFLVRPYPFQHEILDQLQYHREELQHRRNLVVAATGTGKTVVAAFDFKRYSAANRGVHVREATPKATYPSLLFVAHRREILQQSLDTFRHVLGDPTFGELMVGGERPVRGRHVFASVQSLQRKPLSQVREDAYDVVIVDEFHHAAAPTYQRWVDHLQPRYLLGLTATPERMDGQNVQDSWFEGRIAAELRLWDALELGLLCPFQYFGVHDGVDLSGLRWHRGGYETAELDRIYTGNDLRTGVVLNELHRRVLNPRGMRALGFCVSVAHAEYMAQKFDQAEIPSRALTGETQKDDRSRILSELRAGKINAVFAVDVLNEGVDIPEVDTVLLLRPTQSATVFLQQLGRGLRHADDKSCLTVLDFIGQGHGSYRFDVRYAALLQQTPSQTRHSIENGFPYLPSGCSMELDEVAAKIVLDNVRSALRLGRRGHIRLLADYARRRDTVTLAGFLAATDLDIGDLLRKRNESWTELKRRVSVPGSPPGPSEQRLLAGIYRLACWDDPVLTRFVATLATRTAPPAIDDLAGDDRNRIRVLRATLLGLKNKAGGETLAPFLDLLWQNPNVLQELAEITTIATEKAPHPTFHWSGQPEIALRIHASYSRDEILAAFGVEHGVREGTYHDRRTGCDLFFVTLEKSERDYSPTTMYRDYAISPTLFHWQSQSTTTLRSPTARRYLSNRSPHSPALLFVRRRKRADGRTLPYVFAGPVQHVDHEGERPISITWRLERQLPHSIYREFRIAAG